MTQKDQYSLYCATCGYLVENVSKDELAKISDKHAFDYPQHKQYVR